MRKRKILLFAGTNHSQSINRKIVELAAGILNGHQTRLIDLRDFPLPLYSVDLQVQGGVPQAAHTLKEIFEEHDNLVVSVAEHNASVTTCFKNAMDWVSRTQEDYRVLAGKTVWLFSTSPAESGGAGALGHAQDIFSTLGAKIANATAIGGFYGLNQEDVRLKLAQTLDNL